MTVGCFFLSLSLSLFWWSREFRRPNKYSRAAIEITILYWTCVADLSCLHISASLTCPQDRTRFHITPRRREMQQSFVWMPNETGWSVEFGHFLTLLAFILLHWIVIYPIFQMNWSKLKMWMDRTPDEHRNGCKSTNRAFSSASKYANRKTVGFKWVTYFFFSIIVMGIRTRTNVRCAQVKIHTPKFQFNSNFRHFNECICLVEVSATIWKMEKRLKSR